MNLPKEWRARMSLPLVAAPMFLVTGPDLVIAPCRAGVIGTFPTPNARDVAMLDAWLDQIVTSLGEADAPWGANVVVHRSNARGLMKTWLCWSATARLWS